MVSEHAKALGLFLVAPFLAGIVFIAVVYYLGYMDTTACTVGTFMGAVLIWAIGVSVATRYIHKKAREQALEEARRRPRPTPEDDAAAEREAEGLDAPADGPEEEGEGQEPGEEP